MKRNAEALYPCAGSTRTIVERHAKLLAQTSLLQREAAFVLYALKSRPVGRAQAAVTYTRSTGIRGRVSREWQAVSTKVIIRKDARKTLTGFFMYANLL